MRKREQEFARQFNKTDFAKAFCLYDGEKDSLSFRVTLNDGTVIKAGNWENTYDENGTWIIPYVKPRMEKDVTEKKIRNKYK